MANNQPQKVDLTELQPQQLDQVRKQLDQELEHLADSFSKLRAARQKFDDCRSAIETSINADNNGKEILVPLTASLYVPGTLETQSRKVLVDVGTGYYVEKSAPDAVKYYKNKLQYLDANIGELEKAITSKANSSQMVTKLLQEKVQQSQAQTA